MKRIIISLTAVLFVFGSACAQPDTLWTRTYGDISSDAGYGIDETEDGGFSGGYNLDQNLRRR